MQKEITLHAYAKINLVLDVLRKREDGYHDVRMVMQNLDLCDILTFRVTKEETAEPMTDDGMRMKESEAVTDGELRTEHFVPRITITTNRADIPTDSRNLVYRAIALMFETYRIRADICVDIEKHIPVAAGMAGGSTDCAAALHAVNLLFELGLSEQALSELGVKLGADVPYCVMGRTALSEGIGERLTPVTPLADCFVLVAKPNISVSTAAVYKKLKADSLNRHPDVDGMVAALADRAYEAVASRMENVLETVTGAMHPEIAQIERAMKQYGAENAIMSGSGPTVFGLYKSRADAQTAADYIVGEWLADEVFVTVPVSKGYACPCCGNYTLAEKSGSICPVCYWEDDRVQRKDETYAGGANKVSLAQARRNYREFGACERECAANVRKPFTWEKGGSVHEA